jgi:hypothetical protein
MNDTQAVIERILHFFLPHCSDQSTMLELSNMASDPQQWRYAHALFTRIRDKTLKADRTKNELLQYQYSFEEICAKTLFNLSEHYDPQCKPFPERFDDDSAFWVLPLAIAFAHALGMNDFVTSLFGFDKAP